MNTTNTQLAELLTGDKDFDTKLRRAFELGIQHGKVSDREGLRRDTQIHTTKRLLLKLMEVQRLDLNGAMALLQIPKKERETYTRLFAERARQKQAR